MIKPITHDQKQLSQPSQTATRQDLPIAQDLLDTLVAHRQNCVGMAANMIGQRKRIIVVTMGMTNVVMINPQMIAKSNPYQTMEGCLSLTGQRPTRRFKNITVRFLNQDWQQVTLPLSGWVAEIVQHEIDHCDGILI
ncbi:peptide deformylase [uncultured Limosilactobacillus sp.]|uniref:peptide deformylase n=1 Tax=uncultured Limosilactobacillus sp. TaxID=2837629 RepID=UPI0025CDDCC3|nr:peptide deformylase [uncultured Limosilactobacillus sp.]